MRKPSHLLLKDSMHPEVGQSKQSATKVTWEHEPHFKLFNSIHFLLLWLYSLAIVFPGSGLDTLFRVLTSFLWLGSFLWFLQSVFQQEHQCTHSQHQLVSFLLFCASTTCSWWSAHCRTLSASILTLLSLVSSPHHLLWLRSPSACSHFCLLNSITHEKIFLFSIFFFKNTESLTFNLAVHQNQLGNFAN